MSNGTDNDRTPRHTGVMSTVLTCLPSITFLNGQRGPGGRRHGRVKRIVVSSSCAVIVVALVTCTGCARTAVTTGQMRPGSRGPTSAAVYDDSARTIPAGRELDLRLLQALSSNTATLNHAFEAATVSDLRNGPRVIVPAGSLVHGIVRDVGKADDAGSSGRLTLAFAALVANGHSVVIDGTAARLFEAPDLRNQRDSIAVGPSLAGGMVAGLKDELTTNIVSGDGSIVAAKPGADAALAVGTIVRIRLNAAVEIR